LAMVIAGRFRVSGRLAHKVVRLVRALTQCEAHNIHLTRKLDMLLNKPWREQVLKELGGLRKLKLWEAARDRIQAILKAHARLCGRATAHPNIVRDRCKVDFDGLFRLAPLPRGERAKGQVKVYTRRGLVLQVFGRWSFMRRWRLKMKRVQLSPPKNHPRQAF